MTPKKTKEQTIHMLTNQISPFFGTVIQLLLFFPQIIIFMANSGGWSWTIPLCQKVGYIRPIILQITVQMRYVQSIEIHLYLYLTPYSFIVTYLCWYKPHCHNHHDHDSEPFNHRTCPCHFPPSKGCANLLVKSVLQFSVPSFTSHYLAAIRFAICLLSNQISVQRR